MEYIAMTKKKTKKVYYEVRNLRFEYLRKFYKFHRMIDFLRRVGIVDVEVLKFKNGLVWRGSLYQNTQGKTLVKF